MDKIAVGLLGATGTVGQRFIQLLADHPWFEVAAVAASDRSAGKTYGEACHWLLPTEMPGSVSQLQVGALEPGLDCRLVFSALPSSVAGPIEERFAQTGYVVCSNAAPYRLAEDVPLLIPEVNSEHTALIDTQRERRGWSGLVVTSANCTTTQLALALKPLQDAFGLRKASVVSMQAVSGAGYPGVPSMDILGNIVPYIGGEEEKIESEALKVLGTFVDGRVIDSPCVVGARCNRVPVKDGHTECVSLEFELKPEPGEVMDALVAFRGAAAASDLPSSPAQPIVVRSEPDRPQPARDRDAGGGMSVVVGRVRPCPILDIKLVVLGHNTVRGAAGGSIHNAELLMAQGWLK